MDQTFIGSTLLTTDSFSQIKDAFLNELTLASEKKPSSISYLKHTLPQTPIIQSGLIQAIVIGGTNYLSKTAAIHDGKLLNPSQAKTGVLPKLTDSQVFFSFLKR